MKNPHLASAVSRALRSLPLVLLAAGALCADGVAPVPLQGSPDGDPVALPARLAPPVAQLSGSPDGAEASAMPTARDFSMLSEVNRVRAQNGLQPLRYEARLFACAHQHSSQQVRGQYLGHGDRAGGSDTFSTRLRQHGYMGRTIAEVVAGDYAQVADALRKWMDSPAHREMLLDPDMVEAGFACVEGSSPGTNRWTGVLADPVQKATPVAPRMAPPVAAAPAVPQPATRVSAPSSMPVRTPSLAPVRPPLPSAPRVAEPLPSAPRASLPATGGNMVPPPATTRGATALPSAPRTQPLPSAPRAASQPSAPVRTAQPLPSSEPWSPNSLPSYIPAPKPKKVQCVGGT